MVVEKMISILEKKMCSFFLPTGSPNKTGKQSSWLRIQVRTLGGSQAPSEPLVSLVRSSVARTDMCVSGAQEAVHALAERQRKKSRERSTAFAFLVSGFHRLGSIIWS